MIEIEEVELRDVPLEVVSLTRPGMTSVMKRWVSEAKYGDADGLAWLAREDGRLVGWAAIVDGELSIYVKPSERRRGIGSALMKRIGDLEFLIGRPNDWIGERFFRKHGISSW